ncbi:ferredoxin [Methanobrevibacter cuticularis]|uniref:Ferredoxin n=1 Tax=Methanobrevibacter cuticularis TaxID=47311 RepID=A0A166EF23_9EURY|nr:4Fe-4S binding protein [Methanobrevibacter cuticularis]KZX16576.1 ferredoxin [Methanobrevibacter cuticularis]
MEIKFKKPMKDLQREVVLKSVDLDDDIDDFQVDIGDYEVDDKFITISPRCVRCDLCVEECPVDAISSSNVVKRSRIKENCVKCEICAQTCPVSCIYALETKSKINGEKDDAEFVLKEINVPHRVLRMEDISINMELCGDCRSCIRFCPTNAISLKDKSVIEAANEKSYPDLEDRKYPYIDKNLCIGCGSCANLCSKGGIELKRTLGPIIETKKLCIDQDTCVQCFLCEESCPVEAIKLEDDKVVLDNEKCIRCNVCSTKCPVNALSLKNLNNGLDETENLDETKDFDETENLDETKDFDEVKDFDENKD